jgi:hypothetical protein
VKKATPLCSAARALFCATLSLIPACGGDDQPPAEPTMPLGDASMAATVDARAPSAQPDATAPAAVDAAVAFDAAQDASRAVPEASVPPATDAMTGADASSDAVASDASRGDASSGDASSAGDLRSVASGLDALFIDVQCAANTPTPLAEGATCLHPANTQHIERPVTLGGEADKTYAITLRVRGIWEPTKINGGERPVKDHPFNVGGMLPAGTGSSDAVSYQQYSIQVAEPKQTYWLNDHQYLAHAIHKEDYQATIKVRGGAKVTVIMNDGNERQIANFTKAYFQGVPPYDTAPSLGQSLRLDVVSVSVAP